MGQPPQTRSAMVLLYAYAAGNPAGLVDPMGLAACCPGDPGCPPDCKVGDTCFTEDTVVPEPPAPPPPEPEPKPTPPAPEPELEPKIYFAGTLVGTLPRSLLFPQWRAVARGNAIAVAIGIASVLVRSDNAQRCPPCKPPGRPYSEIDRTHDHWPCKGAHIHHYVPEVNQIPYPDCKCTDKDRETGVTCLEGYQDGAAPPL